jgi:hypothetical protein
MLPTLWLGGYSLKLWMNWPAIACAGTKALRRERLHAVEREGELEVHRLLGPQRAVVVEHGDALGWNDEILIRVVR